ncbi:unnamed protein product [Colias eurytheme]|nr:unnamed protein product [Colias eurytheme]
MANYSLFLFVLFATIFACRSTPTGMEYEMSCGPDQIFLSCQPCEKTCSSPTNCTGACITGCFCKDDLFRAPDGSCVKLEDCPTAEVTLSDANEPSIEECQSDEVYVGCGWCERTCSDPSPKCPSYLCTRGCLCRPPLLRHHSGHCVEAKDCLPRKCTKPNEEYTCRYGCEPRCKEHFCIRPRRCLLGCHCKLGLLRDQNGNCVTYENCTITITTKPPINT